MAAWPVSPCLFTRPIQSINCSSRPAKVRCARHSQSINFPAPTAPAAQPNHSPRQSASAACLKLLRVVVPSLFTSDLVFAFFSLSLSFYVRLRLSQIHLVPGVTAIPPTLFLVDSSTEAASKYQDGSEAGDIRVCKALADHIGVCRRRVAAPALRRELGWWLSRRASDG